MYPVVRFAKAIFQNRGRPAPALGEAHVTDIMVWPWDIDPFFDLNNGRILTLMDMGRIGLFARMGIPKVMKAKGWYGTVAGSTVRYRRRITVFQRLQLRTRVIGWDARFIYFDQAFWRGEECCAHAVIRTAITTGRGIVPTGDVAEAIGFAPESPELPEWIKAWDAAERQRPWPPEF